MPVNNAAAAAAAAAARAAAEAARRAAEAAARAAAAARAKAQAQAAAKAHAAQAAAEKQRAAAANAQKKAAAAQQQARAKAEQAAKAQQRVTEAQSHLAAQQAALAQHPQNTAAAKQIEASQKGLAALQTQAREARVASEAAARSARSLTEKANAVASQAVHAEQKANSEFSTAGLAAPYSTASQVHDALGGAVPTAASTKQLLHAGISVSDAAKAEAARLSSIRDPAAQATMLSSLAASSTDPHYQSALIQAAGPQLTALSHQIVDHKSGFTLDQRQQALNTLTGLSEKLKPDAQQALATAFASGIGNATVGTGKDNFGALLENSITSGSGASFGARLTTALQSQGKTETANTAASSLAAGIHEVKAKFEQTSKKLEELKTRMGSELAAWNLKGRDLKTAVAQFQQDNHVGALQQQLEAEGATLASTIPGANLAATDPALEAAASQTTNAGYRGLMVSQVNGGLHDLVANARGAVQDLPQLAATRAGADLIASSVRAEGEGAHTFLSHLGEYAEQGHKGEEFLAKTRTAVVSSVGVGLMHAAQNGNYAAASTGMLKGLTANPELLGLSKDNVGGIAKALGGFKPGMTNAQLKAASLEYKGALNKAFVGAANGGETGAGKLLSGLGAAFGIASAVGTLSHFDQNSFSTNAATILGTISGAKDIKDTATTVAGILSRFQQDTQLGGDAATAAKGASGLAGATDAAAAAGMGAKVLEKGLGAIGVAASAFSLANDITNGNTQAAVGDGLSTIGGAVMLATGASGVGLLVGGALVAAGALVSLFAPSENPFAKNQDELKAELKAIGANDQVAEELKSFTDKGTNWGSWVSQVAQKANLTTGDFVRSMNGWTAQELSQFLDAGRLQLSTDDNNGNRLRNATAVIGTAANKLEDAHFNFDGGDAAAQQFASQAQAQRDYRAHVDDQTGEITYRADLVQAAANWVSAVNYRGPH